MTAASGRCDISLRVHTVELDHKVAVLLVSVRGLARVDAAEELWQ